VLKLCKIGIHKYDTPKEVYFNGNVVLLRACNYCKKIDGKEIPSTEPRKRMILVNGAKV
jgi:hypothetical protein